MDRFSRYCLLIVLLVCAAPTASHCTEIGFNLYGLSYHTDRDAAESLDFNELNLGFGFQVAFLESDVGPFFGEGGFFKDTFREIAGYVGLGYKFRIVKPLSAGLMLARYTSQSINGGNSVNVPVPVVSLRVGFLSANVVDMSKHEPVNNFSWFGAYLTLHASKKKK